MKSLRTSVIILVALFSASHALPFGGLTHTQLSSADLPKDLVLIGTVTKIYPFASPIVRRSWAVRAHVDRVVSGTFSGTTFTFTVHSPAQAGLRVGRAYTIKAHWTIEGYVVDESTLRGAAIRTKPSAKR